MTGHGVQNGGSHFQLVDSQLPAVNIVLLFFQNAKSESHILLARFQDKIERALQPPPL